MSRKGIEDRARAAVNCPLELGDPGFKLFEFLSHFNPRVIAHVLGLFNHVSQFILGLVAQIHDSLQRLKHALGDQLCSILRHPCLKLCDGRGNLLGGFELSDASCVVRDSAWKIFKYLLAGLERLQLARAGTRDSSAARRDLNSARLLWLASTVKTREVSSVKIF